ncbi:MAG: PqqD family protein [Rhodomicrobium sp.]
MPIDLSTVVKQAADQVSCNLNGEYAILNLKSTLYFGLNQTGAHIWEAMKEPIAVTDICETVCSRFDVGEEQCRSDTLALVGALEKAGLIEIVERAK